MFSAEQYLHGPQLFGRLANKRSLGAPQGVSSILTVVETDRRQPLINQAIVLSSAQVAKVIDATGKGEIAKRATTPDEPSRQAIACLGHDFELHWLAGLLPHHCGPIPEGSTADQIANPHFDEVTTTQFAVDRKIKQASISDTLVLVEKKADRPNVAGPQRSFWTDLPDLVPRILRLGLGGIR